MPSSSFRRPRPRRRVAAVALVVAAIAIAACGDDTPDDAGGSTIPAPAASASPSSTTAPSVATTIGSDAFPVTIPHAFGETTIESEPERIVSIGFTDHDVLLALGVEPIAIRQWYGEHEYVWPWAEDALGTLTPTVLPSGDLNMEQIAALDPDLIVGLYVGLDEAQYETLSAIAPTVAYPAEHPAFGAPWQVITRTAGAAVGRSAAAEALVADIEGRFAAARQAHPEFADVELAYAGVYGTDTANYYVETNGSTRMGVLQDLGFVVPEELAALGTDSFYHDISAEQIDLVDQDVVLWEPAVLELLPAVEDNEMYQQLPVAIEERDVFLTDPLVAGAMAHADVLSLPVVLDFLVPELARAVANLDR